MDGLEHSLSLIGRHSTFLLLVLPVVGALLVALSAPWGREIVLRTALTNVIFAIAVSVLMLIQFDASPVVPKGGRDHVPRFQMASSSRLDIAADTTPNFPSLLRIDVGVDGVSLWFVVLMPLVTLAAVNHARNERHLTALVALLLLLQASLTGLFAALNVVQFVVCLEVSGLLLFLVIGRWGGPDHRRDVAPLVVFQFAGSLLVFFGLAALVVSHSWLHGLTVREGGDPTAFTFSLASLVTDPPLILRQSDPAAEAWSPAEALIYWTLLPGFAIKSAVFPFHRGFCPPGGAWPACVGVFAYGVFPCVGVYGFLRIVAPVCEQTLAVHAAALAALLLLGSVYCGLLALAQSELQRTVACASIAHAGLAFAATISQSAAGISGAVFHLIGHVAGFSLLAAVVAAMERRYETLEIRAFAGLGGRLPWVAAAFFVAAFALCGLPGLSGFPALWQTLIGLVGLTEGAKPSMANAAMSLIVTGLLAWALLATGQRIFWGSLREPLPDFRILMPSLAGSEPWESRKQDVERQNEIRDWGASERTVALLFTAVLLAVGVAPQFVAERVDCAVKPIVADRVAGDRTTGNEPPANRRSLSAFETTGGRGWSDRRERSPGRAVQHAGIPGLRTASSPGHPVTRREGRPL